MNSSIEISPPGARIDLVTLVKAVRGCSAVPTEAVPYGWL